MAKYATARPDTGHLYGELIDAAAGVRHCPYCDAGWYPKGKPGHAQQPRARCTACWPSYVDAWNALKDMEGARFYPTDEMLRLT